VCATVVVLALAGCAGTSADRGVEAITQSASTAWALSAASLEPVVAVSPAQRSLRIAGSAGTVIGTSITAVENDRYRRMVLEGLGDYAPGALFEATLRARLGEHFGENEVAPLGSTAGYHSRREVTDARYDRVAAMGHESLLDVKMTHGLFGPRAVLAVSLENTLVTLPGGGRRYAREIIALPGPLLANATAENPMSGMLPDFGENLLGVESGAVERWLEQGGEPYRAAFEQLMEDAVAALLTELGRIDDARGHYTLGRQALRERKPDEALTHFDRALALDPAMLEGASARSVALASAGQFAEAVAAAEAVLAHDPSYGPAHFNLAWWHAVELKQPDAAREHYAQAQALGMPAARKIEKALS
jgi:tetratricopeptide (TPR) repeat protein